jgi:hypothetical protein
MHKIAQIEELPLEFWVLVIGAVLLITAVVFLIPPSGVL